LCVILKPTSLNRTTDIISISTIGQIPTLETIRAIPRELTLKLVFDNGVQSQRETIGQNLKKELVGFQVGVHTFEPEINIAKLITDEEIEDNKDFFEQCAKDYRHLGKELIFKLADKLDITINQDYPMMTFNELKSDKRQIGKVENWRYFVHGFHCGFENNITGQIIEVPLVFGLEFGDLDPHFFTKYIKSTPKYNPLPIDIFEDYADGVRINEKMISLGKFERIGSNVGGHYGIVVTDRQKVEIKSFDELNKLCEKQNMKIEIPKFNFWKFIRLKK
jgi:hypothetical protein